MLVDDVISAMCLGGSGGCGVPGSGGSGEGNGEATVAGARLNQGSRLATFLAPSPQARDPSAPRLLPAHSCADASTRERKSSSGAPPTNPPSPSGPQKKYTFLVMTKYFTIFESKFLLSFLKETFVLLT